MKKITLIYGLLAALAVLRPSLADSFCYPELPDTRVEMTETGYIWHEKDFSWVCTWADGFKMQRAVCEGTGTKEGRGAIDATWFEIDGDTLFLGDLDIDISEMTRCD